MAARVEVLSLFVAGSGGDAARALAERWAGGEAHESLARAADPAPLELPRGSLPPAKLRDYLGPEASATVLELELGAVSDPILVEGGAWVLKLIARVPGEVPPFEELREQVETDRTRELEDRALAQLLTELREDARIEVAWERL